MLSKYINEFGAYDPYEGLAQSEIAELHGWLDSVDSAREVCHTMIVEFDPNEDVPF